MMSLNDQYSNYNGWLEKKSHSLIGGWQKRYFRILDGQVMLYFESDEDKKPKGHISFQWCTQAISIDSCIFKFDMSGKEIILKATDDESKNEWIEAINYCIDYHKQNHYLIDESPSIQKIKSLNKKEIELLTKHGLILNGESELSKRLLETKKIKSMINMNHLDIKNRIHYGFLNKKQRNHDIYQKRWFFIISSRPLSDDLYEKDDISLGDNIVKQWMKYDNLVYFNYDEDEENNDNNAINPKTYYDLSECHTINIHDEDDLYHITLDIKDQKHEFYSEIKGERDKWFEVLKNSRKTAKEIKGSITKHPRNIYRLLNMLTGNNTIILNSELDKEKIFLIGDYTLM